MELKRLSLLERKLVRLDGAYLEIRPEKSSEFRQIKQLLGQGLYSRLL